MTASEHDIRLEVLRQHGIVGTDARTCLAAYDAHGGLKGAHEALARQFGQDAVRAALALIAGPLR